MPTLRLFFFRWAFAIIVLCGSFLFMGSAFAPSILPFKIPLDPVRLDSFTRPPAFSVPAKKEVTFRRHASFSRLDELVQTQRAVSTSA